MGKAAWAAPMYISVAWTLMISYQLFTQTAVTTVVTALDIVMPSIGVWLSSRIDMVIFVYSFAWVFVLSSVIPSVILGKERSVLVQFFVCLVLTFLALIAVDLLETFAQASLNQLLGLSFVFNNLILAAIYLSLPYIFMLALDIKVRMKKQNDEDLESPVMETGLISETDHEQELQTVE